MTIEEAFKILDLPGSSTIDEIEKKYKSLIKHVHPDKQNGNNEIASALNNAREIAVKHVSEMGTSLTVIRQVAELIKVDNTALLKRQEYRTQGDAIFNRASRRSVNKYKQMQSTTKLFGAFSAIMALVSSNILPIFENYFVENPIFVTVFTGLAFVTGIFYLTFNTMTERFKDSLDDFKEVLDDKASYYGITNSILWESIDLNKVFSRSEFEKAIQIWLNTSRHEMRENLEFDSLIERDTIRRTARRIGVKDFSKLIISKGLEKGIIKEIELNENEFPTIGYSFKNMKGT